MEEMFYQLLQRMKELTKQLQQQSEQLQQQSEQLTALQEIIVYYSGWTEQLPFLFILFAPSAFGINLLHAFTFYQRRGIIALTCRKPGVRQK